MPASIYECESSRNLRLLARRNRSGERPAAKSDGCLIVLVRNRRSITAKLGRHVGERVEVVGTALGTTTAFMALVKRKRWSVVWSARSIYFQRIVDEPLAASTNSSSGSALNVIG